MKYSQAVVLGCIGAATLASARPANSRLRDPDAIPAAKPAPRQGSVGEHFGLNQRSYDDDLLFLRDFFEEYSELALRAPTKAATSGPKAKVPATHSTTSSTTHGQTGTKHTTGSTTNHALTKDHASTDKKLTGTNTNSRTTTGAKHPSTHEKTLPHQEHATNGRTTTGANHPSTATNGRTTTGANHPSTADKSQVHKEHTTNGRTTPGSKPSPAEGKGPTHQTNTALRKPGEKSTTTPGKPHTEHDLHGGKQSLTGDKLNHQREQHLKDANGRLQHQLQGSQQSLKKDQSTIHRLEREKNTWEHRAAVNAYRRPAPYYAPPPAYGYRPRPYGGYGGYGGGYYRRDFADETELLARELADELDARDFDIEDLLEMRSFGDFEVDELD